jgi:hypothetical protein
MDKSSAGSEQLKGDPHPLVPIKCPEDLTETSTTQCSLDLVAAGEKRPNQVKEFRFCDVPVWGIACKLDRGAPVVVAVQVTGPRATLSIKRVWGHRATASNKRDWSKQLVDLAADFDTALRTASRTAAPSAIVVRSIDWNRRQKDTTTRPRHQVDGVLMATARKHVNLVEALSGKQIGTQCGSSKDEVEDEVRAAVAEALVDAGAAGIAGLVLAGED